MYGLPAPRLTYDWRRPHELKSVAFIHDKLEQIVMPLFVHNRDDFVEIMRHAIALNGSFFNTERMVDQYVRKAYFR